jgi:hypothetical protein
MGRPSVLTEPMKVEIGRRLAAGESLRAVSKATGVSYSTLRDNFSAQVPEIRDVAQALASAESRLLTLPVSAQQSARSLADQLKTIQSDYAAVAAKGARTANRIADLAGRVMDGEAVDPNQIANAAVAAELHKAANVALIPATAMVTGKGGASEIPVGSDPVSLNITPVKPLDRVKE